MQEQNNQKEVLAGFLDCISFDYFCTFTTRKPIGIKSCRRNAVDVYNHLLKHDRETSFFWCAEKFDLQDGMKSSATLRHPVSEIISSDYTSTRYHWHALAKGTFDKYAVFDWYFKKYGRCQLIDNREPDRQLAASHYVSKYVTKSLADFDIYLSSRDRGLQTTIQFNPK